MNAAWGGQWDMHEIMISLGSHQTTDNLAVNPEFTVTFATADTLVASDYVGIASGRNTPGKMQKAGWTIEKAPNVNAPVFKEFPMTLECRVKQKIDETGRRWQTRCGEDESDHLRSCSSYLHPAR